MDTANPRITLTLPREETITDFSIVLNQHYCKATKVNLYFDKDPKPVTLNTEISTERQDFTLQPRKASSLTIELAGFDKTGPTTGIDNVWVKVARSPEWHAKVKPLLNVGGLVKYPDGQGRAGALPAQHPGARGPAGERPEEAQHRLRAAAQHGRQVQRRQDTGARRGARLHARRPRPTTATST